MALYGIYGQHTTEACPWNNINTARRLQAFAEGGLESAAQAHHIRAILGQYHSALEHTAAPTKFEAELPTSEMYILVARDAP